MWNKPTILVLESDVPYAKQFGATAASDIGILAAPTGEKESCYKKV